MSKISNQRRIGMRKNYVKPEQFVRLWLEAVQNREKVSWIANKIGCSDQSVHAMASALRKSGVELPKIRRTFVETIKVDDMNKLIREKFGD